MNRVLKLLMVSDIFVGMGFGLISPILAIFIKEDLIGGSIFAAGFASTLFIVVKSIIQLPLAKFVDRHDHKMKFLIAGMFLISAVPFIYVFTHHINMLYLAQIIYGIGAAFAVPTWLSLWSINLDKKREGFEWSVYSTSVGLGTAITASLGAGLAQIVGFQITFAIVGVMSLVGTFILFALARDEHKKLLIKEVQYHRARKSETHNHVI